MAPKRARQYTDLRTEAIVGAAWDSFCATGYRSASMRDIAKRMNASTGVIYTYFKNKREVLEAVLEHSSTRNSHIFQQLSKNHQGLNAIRAAFNVAFESIPLDIQTRNSRGNIGLWMEAMRDEKIRKLLNVFYLDFLGHLRRFVTQAIRMGEIDDDRDASAIAGCYLALFIGFQVQQALMEGTPTKAPVKNISLVVIGQGAGRKKGRKQS